MTELLLSIRFKTFAESVFVKKIFKKMFSVFILTMILRSISRGSFTS